MIMEIACARRWVAPYPCHCSRGLRQGRLLRCLSTVPSNLLSKRPHASEFQDSTDHLVGPQHWLVAEEIEFRAVARSPRH